MLKKMLKAAAPKVELPPWFELKSTSASGRTELKLEIRTADGERKEFSQSIEKDNVSVMDMLGLWPGIAEKVPAMFKRILEVLPVPKTCSINGSPVPAESTPTKERARLAVTAEVMGKVHDWHWDSSLDRLYMADLVEVADWLKAIQVVNDTKAPAGS